MTNAESFATVGGTSVSYGLFLSEAAALAQVLPPCSAVINLCENRYRFALGFVAAMAKGVVTLMPPDRSALHLESLLQQHPGALILRDETAHADTSSWIVGRYLDDRMGPITFDIDPHRIVLVAYTSGSTGLPQPQPKTLASLKESARLIDLHLGGVNGKAVVATVPIQHMYGLELSLLLPLFCGAILQEGKPFYPADIVASLARTADPAVLVTTPVHLRALIGSGLSLPPIELLVSATAPLDRALASQAEDRFGAPLLEIYGCTEAGSIAGRRPSQAEEWTLFEPVRMHGGPRGIHVTAPHLSEPVWLQDLIEPLDARQFRLSGRQVDLINIAGKRGSLAALNRVLLDIEGVVDGTFFLPDDTHQGTTRMVVFVVAPTLTHDSVLQQLRQRIDPAFMPRVVHQLESLPRNATGKLPLQALQRLLNRSASA